MSRSPEDARVENAGDYVEGMAHLNRLLRDGHALSGRERNCAFLNTGDRRFATASGVFGIDRPDDGRALVAVDWDRDGDLDLWASNRTAPQVRVWRNEVGSDSAPWIQVRLENDRANRDGIGARVTVVRGSGPSLKRTLAAGEGFLSQSSKWMHFGLGEHDRIESIEVRWPDGAIERFSDVKARARWRLRRGDGRARRAEGPRAPASSLASRSLPTRPTGIVSRGPIRGLAPLPALAYTEAAGRVAETSSGSGLLLVNLWAGWCGPCVGELSELAEHRAELAAAGVRVVALSVDGLDPAASDEERARDRAAAARVAEDLAFPHPWGFVEAESLETLDAFFAALYGRRRPIRVPTTLLLDASGMPAVLYKGTIDPETLLQDARALRSDPVRFRAGASRGRWDREPARGLAGAVVEALAERSLDRADRYLDTVRSVGRGVPDIVRDPAFLASLQTIGARRMRDGDAGRALALFREAFARGARDVALLENLGRAAGATGDHVEAERRLRAAVDADADRPLAWRDLGAALANLGRFPEASDALMRARALDADDPRTHALLGNVFGDLGRFEEARGALRTAVRLAPGDADAHAALGGVAWMLEDPEEANRHLGRAVEIDPESSARLPLAVVLQATGRGDEAIPHYRAAAGRSPSPLVLQNLAWLLATTPVEAARDGVEAERWARRACDATGWREPGPLDALAAALAAQGRFDEAVDAAARAERAARGAGQASFADVIRDRAAGYRAGRPWIEGADAGTP